MATSCAAQQDDPVAPTRCPEMSRLRDEAKQLQEQMRVVRQRARQHEQTERRCDRRGSHSNDYVGFLQRKLLKNSLNISRHVAEHACEQLGTQR